MKDNIGYQDHCWGKVDPGFNDESLEIERAVENKVNDIVSDRESVLEFMRNSRGAYEYDALCEEILRLRIRSGG